MRRRNFIKVIGGAAGVAFCLSKVSAQAPSKRPLVAAVVGSSKQAADRFFDGFLQGMHELGYVEGRDYGFEVRYADGDRSRIALLTKELLALKPDVMVQSTMTGVIAAKKLTDAIPIVSEALTEPIDFGFVASHARPGGNVTGVLLTVEDLPTKLLALAIETVPGIDKIGLLVNPTNPIQPLFHRSLEAPAKKLGVELIASEAGSRDDLQAALKRLAHAGAKMVLALQDTMYVNEGKRIALFAIAERLPTMFGFRENVDDGGLMSYGTNLRESFRRLASFVDKILKGDKPADLPIEFPTKLYLVINLTTAKALGLNLPPMLLARADEVIE
jgi:putative ABC transport system substrate-binding protein